MGDTRSPALVFLTHGHIRNKCIKCVAETKMESDLAGTDGEKTVSGELFY